MLPLSSHSVDDGDCTKTEDECDNDAEYRSSRVQALAERAIPSRTIGQCQICSGRDRDYNARVFEDIASILARSTIVLETFQHIHVTDRRHDPLLITVAFAARSSGATLNS